MIACACKLPRAAERRDDDGLDGLAAVGVANADHANLLNVGMGVEHRLDLRRPYFETRGVDHAFQAVGDEEIAFLVVVAEVAGPKEALAVMIEKRLRGRHRLPPISLEHLWAVHNNLADLVGPAFG